ncbi:hypothetical protein ONA70_02230 [Micromonospora yasonensis]|uniref:hypothetical protein n=1 Tax=Micromonospora yasonensis TaxID=1128667 RepID=UPI002230FB5E|nr:hypothetical protein [Micromonospora yasonensis]MCW3838914.1 hypothetical protein [Micromonospora yasonensis]
MNSIPVDLSRLSGLLCVSAPERKTDLDGEVRKDRDGNALWVTGIAVRRAGTRKASVIDVQTSAEPEGVTEGSPVGVTELDVSLWEIEGRHGLSYKAASVYPVRARTDNRSGSGPASTAVPAPSQRERGGKANQS